MNKNIPIHIINHARDNIRYANTELDSAFRNIVKRVTPDVIHMGHLNHLSTGFVDVAKEYGAPIVFTLHDFWLMCPRGQFLQTKLTSGEPWELCNGQDHKKCATNCMNRFHSGVPSNVQNDEKIWTNWVAKRMDVVRDACDKIDLFIAPSEHLMNRFVSEFGIPQQKIRYIDYGFDLNRLQKPSTPRQLSKDGFVFGYIGRHHPSKGIDMLITAFSKIQGKATLIIWGRAEGQLTSSLKRLVSNLSLVDKTIEWREEYQNEHIVRDVFLHCDCIVVPSIWDENSPLVIHEAQQVRIPVITADHGGMKEFVTDNVNGLLFQHRNTVSLQQCLQKAIDNPLLMASLGNRGYIKSTDGNIPSIQDHVEQLVGNYEKLLVEKQPLPLELNEVPWRITFDTNPDDCNLHCIMCEEHSPLSTLQTDRKAEISAFANLKTGYAGIRRRRMDIGVVRKIVSECAGKGLKEIVSL